MKFNLSEALHIIGQVMMKPCLIILLLLMVIAIWQLGDMLVELLVERRKLKKNHIPQLLEKIHEGNENLDTVIEESGLTSRQKNLLCTLLHAKHLPKVSLIALAQRLLATEEEQYEKTTAITDLIIRLGPMFGLLGTLIPLGPGIVALGNGDTAALSKSLGVAFDTTIAGMIAAGIACVISNLRKRWYNSDMVTLESVMECVLEEVTVDD
ncbi:MotA/TolQ/ExbB proton channel family protein [Sinanaerobacter sp. ZZT-01]|uniref:MotA/TolQ/ExbB proton channel family protein n=1 Tax=Sinanaerobacter sp. ZZT-01 TaxID=3111540 RepID=UPI002D79A01E|nr:MotA/TolQ/ExbB proton channel family protein [Sinanaerobacter sp. ZZT-01]WRR94816.1 MotA/TolQ/ExbB proton channel family protein [Sinanaerobacter sp. ZZT-01]